MFTVKVDASGVMAKFETMLPSVHDMLRSTVDRDVGTVLARARSLASGDVLQVDSGKYLASIKSQIYDTDKRVYGKVFSRDPRANLFEWGGSTPARIIGPNAAQAMAFQMPSVGEVFAKVVHRPVVHYKPHSVIHAALDEQKDQIEQDIETAVRGTVSDLF